MAGEKILQQLQTLESDFRLGHMLCCSRDPDLLMDIMRRETPAQSILWLSHILSQDPDTLHVLPSACLAELLLSASFRQSLPSLLPRLTLGLLRHLTTARPDLYILQFFLLKLADRKRKTRLTAKKALSLLLLSVEACPVPEQINDEAMSEIVLNQREAAWSEYSWMRLLALFSTGQAMIRDTLLRALRTETHPHALAAYLAYLSTHSDLPFIAMLAKEVTVLVQERGFVSKEALRNSSIYILVCKVFRQALHASAIVPTVWEGEELIEINRESQVYCLPENILFGFFDVISAPQLRSAATLKARNELATLLFTPSASPGYFSLPDRTPRLFPSTKQAIAFTMSNYAPLIAIGLKRLSLMEQIRVLGAGVGIGRVAAEAILDAVNRHLENATAPGVDVTITTPDQLLLYIVPEHDAQAPFQHALKIFATLGNRVAADLLERLYGSSGAALLHPQFNSTHDTDSQNRELVGNSPVVALKLPAVSTAPPSISLETTKVACIGTVISTRFAGFIRKHEKLPKQLEEIVLEMKANPEWEWHIEEIVERIFLNNPHPVTLIYHLFSALPRRLPSQLYPVLIDWIEALDPALRYYPLWRSVFTITQRTERSASTYLVWSVVHGASWPRLHQYLGRILNPQSTQEVMDCAAALKLVEGYSWHPRSWEGSVRKEYQAAVGTRLVRGTSAHAFRPTDAVTLLRYGLAAQSGAGQWEIVYTAAMQSSSNAVATMEFLTNHYSAQTADTPPALTSQTCALLGHLWMKTGWQDLWEGTVGGEVGVRLLQSLCKQLEGDDTVQTKAAKVTLLSLAIRKPDLILSHLSVIASLLIGHAHHPPRIFVERGYHGLFYRVLELLDTLRPAIYSATDMNGIWDEYFGLLHTAVTNPHSSHLVDLYALFAGFLCHSVVAAPSPRFLTQRRRNLLLQVTEHYPELADFGRALELHGLRMAGIERETETEYLHRETIRTTSILHLRQDLEQVLDVAAEPSPAIRAAESALNQLVRLTKPVPWLLALFLPHLIRLLPHPTHAIRDVAYKLILSYLAHSPRDADAVLAAGSYIQCFHQSESAVVTDAVRFAPELLLYLHEINRDVVKKVFEQIHVLVTDTEVVPKSLLAIYK
eukprot:TRINITY_DN8428_c0_g1_i2.p1 TRINITY_DN8428_c0_g1~~TRINITY_DN8428_c0_g1_i2.p1  ORF type:complete len:1109 (+),score=97.73 TRINITY_DN8428_c0_g1_i2:2417-5743(+)